jgi:hypothetical protein
MHALPLLYPAPLSFNVAQYFDGSFLMGKFTEAGAV